MPRLIQANDYGVGWRRQRSSYVLGAIQEDDRGRHLACALSRRGASAHRPTWRTSTSLFRHLVSCIEYIKVGKLRALAVTGATRMAALPDIPAVGALCLATRRVLGTGRRAENASAAIIDGLNTEINADLADPGMEMQLPSLDTALRPRW